MNLFTPAFLAFVPLWATSLALQSVIFGMRPLPLQAPTKSADEDMCPTQWAGMPFTPPAVHAA